MKMGVMVLTAALVAGCAAATDTRDSRREEEMQYRRESKHIEALERFEQFKRSCARSGGIVFVRRSTGGPLARTPTAMEMNAASCSPAALF